MTYVILRYDNAPCAHHCAQLCLIYNSQQSSLCLPCFLLSFQEPGCSLWNSVTICFSFSTVISPYNFVSIFSQMIPYGVISLLALATATTAPISAARRDLS
jgi:hypothetical protein